MVDIPSICPICKRTLYKEENYYDLNFKCSRGHYRFTKYKNGYHIDTFSERIAIFPYSLIRTDSLAHLHYNNGKYGKAIDVNNPYFINSTTSCCINQLKKFKYLLKGT